LTNDLINNQTDELESAGYYIHK